MIEAGINYGDLALIIKDKPIIKGDIYAVLVDGDATLKKVYKNEDYLTLQPCNSKYEPIMVKKKIFGNIKQSSHVHQPPIIITFPHFYPHTYQQGILLLYYSNVNNTIMFMNL